MPHLWSFYLGGIVASLLGVAYVSQQRALSWPERIAGCLAALIWPVALLAALTIHTGQSS